MSPTTRSAKGQKSASTDNSGALEKDCVLNLPVRPVKGYKITDNQRSRRFGIGARCLEELKAKASSRFEVGEEVSFQEVGMTGHPQH